MRRSKSGGEQHDELRGFLEPLGLESHLAALVAEDVREFADAELSQRLGAEGLRHLRVVTAFVPFSTGICFGLSATS